MDFGPEFIGKVNSVGLLAFAIASLPSGAIGARWGIRPAMIAGMIMMFTGGMLAAAANILPDPWLGPAIMTLWVVMYVGLAIYFVNSVPFVMEIASPSEYPHAFPLQTAILALAAFTGALVGGFLPWVFAQWLGVDQHHPLPYRLPLLFASLMLIPAIWIILRIPFPRPGQKADALDAPTLPRVQPEGLVPSVVLPTRSSGWRRGSPVIMTIVLLSVVRFFQVSGIATTGTFFNVYMDTELAVPTAQIGLIAAVARLGAVFAALSTPLLITRFSAPNVVLLASAITTVSLLPLALVPHWGAAGIGFLGVTALASMRYPAFMLFSMTLVPPSWRGTLAGVGEFAGGISFALMALIGGYMIAASGFSALFLLGSSLTLVGTLLFYLWYVAPRAKPTPTPAPAAPPIP